MEKPITFRQLVYDTVAEIIETKSGSVAPCMAHITEIRNSLNVELKETLRELCREGKLGYHIDISKNPMFEIKAPYE